jgi:hypothetical protein
VRAKRTSIALLLAAGLAGCGSSGGNSQALTRRQVHGLVTQLETARAAAAARNVAGTKLALEKFRASVARLRRDGALTDDAARSLRIGAARVLARVKTDNPTPARAPAPTPTPTPAPTATQTAPAPAPLPPGQKKKHEEKQKHGKGHGNKHGGDD